MSTYSKEAHGFSHLSPFCFISQRILDKNRNLRGYIVATREQDSDKFNVGFSLKNPKDPVFNKDWGMYLAFVRSLLDHSRQIKVPVSIKNDVKKMTERGSKYFKTAYSGNCTF